MYRLCWFIKLLDELLNCFDCLLKLLLQAQKQALFIALVGVHHLQAYARGCCHHQSLNLWLVRTPTMDKGQQPCTNMEQRKPRLIQ